MSDQPSQQGKNFWNLTAFVLMFSVMWILYNYHGQKEPPLEFYFALPASILWIVGAYRARFPKIFV